MKWTTIYKSLRGSHASGTNTPESDRDLFEIVIPSSEALIGLGNMKGSQHIKEKVDTRVITLKEFINGALKGKSTEVEVLFVKPGHVLFETKEGYALRQNAPSLLSQRTFNSILGFFRGQFKNALNGNKDRYRNDLGYDPKSVAHAARAMWQAIQFKKTGQFHIFIEDATARLIVMKMKLGELTQAQVIAQLEDFKAIFDELPENPNIQKQPNHKFWNDFIINTQFEYLKTELENAQ
jgi:predicted nucleotidyltransferase